MTPEEQAKQLVRDYQFAFGTPDGLRVLEDLSKQCYEHELTFVDGNPNGTAFNCGKRYVILHIRRLLSMEL
jgi:hypothetical protein